MSARVDALMTLYATLSDAQQDIVRDMVELAWDRVGRRLLAERLAKSVPFTVIA